VSSVCEWFAVMLLVFRGSGAEIIDTNDNVVCFVCYLICSDLLWLDRLLDQLSMSVPVGVGVSSACPDS
jgi:hypothetical protein